LSQGAVETALWALVPDLMLRTRLAGQARAAGTGWRAFSDARALVTALDEGPPRLVLLDLHAPQDAAFTLLAALATRTPRPRTLGFFSHVDVATRERALAAGCDRVVPRSALVNRFAVLVADPEAESDQGA